MAIEGLRRVWDRPPQSIIAKGAAQLHAPGLEAGRLLGEVPGRIPLWVCGPEPRKLWDEECGRLSTNRPKRGNFAILRFALVTPTRIELVFSP